MQFYRYGIDLERLEDRHLEMVRQWRNAVRLRMRYQKEIGPEAQIEWFKNLDAHDDWYFVAAQNEMPFGLFYVKHVDWARKAGEAGGFVGDPKLVGGVEAGITILALMDFAFLILGLDFLEANYPRGQAEIVLLNRQLGYEKIEEAPDEFIRARVSAAGYFRATEKLREAAVKIRGSEARLSDAERWLTEHIKKLNPNGPSLLAGSFV